MPVLVEGMAMDGRLALTFTFGVARGGRAREGGGGPCQELSKWHLMRSHAIEQHANKEECIIMRNATLLLPCMRYIVVKRRSYTTIYRPMPSHTSGADTGIDSGPSFFSSVEWVAADDASSIENEFLSSRAQVEMS